MVFAGRTALERKTVAEAAADELRMRILSGALQEGAQLRQEVLAAELGRGGVGVVLEAYDRMSAAVDRGGSGWEPLATMAPGFGPRHPMPVAMPAHGRADPYGELTD